MDQWKKNNLKSHNSKKRLQQSDHVKNRGIETVIEELKQRLKVKTAKIKKYEDRNNQYTQNRPFRTNQKR